MSKTISIATLDDRGAFDVYVAEPAGTPRAAIVVIQEIFGVNAGIRAKADALAEAGYLALAPDLFWPIAPGIQLDPDVPEQMEQALGLMGRFDQDAGIRDIAATIRTARGMLGDVQSASGIPARVGVVGYCLGGRLAFMAAARTDTDASVGYYGVGIDGLLNEAHAIAHPVLLHIPQDDHFVDKDAQARMHAGLDDHAKVTLYDYPGEDHGFAAQSGQRRSEASANLADERTMAFFAEHLG